VEKLDDNKAIIFVGRKQNNMYWEQYELEKAITFFNSLKAWWTNDTCTISIHAENFPHPGSHPNHTYIVNPNPTRDALNTELETDGLVADGTYVEYVLKICDHSPLYMKPNQKRLNLKKVSGVVDPYLASMLKQRLEEIKTKATNKTMIISGENSGYFAQDAHHQYWKTIASHWMGIPLGQYPDFDKFNIGVVMIDPILSIPKNDWDMAFDLELIRLANLPPPLAPQTPLKWP
jgi:hypothetical protein